MIVPNTQDTHIQSCFKGINRLVACPRDLVSTGGHISQGNLTKGHPEEDNDGAVLAKRVSMSASIGLVHRLVHRLVHAPVMMCAFRVQKLSSIYEDGLRKG